MTEPQTKLPDANSIRAALLTIAHLLDGDPAYGPLFDRLEADLRAAETRESGETASQRRARALLRGH